MAALAYPATVVSLLLSDVIGDPIDVIGSGPTAPIPRLSDAREVLAKYKLSQRVPASVRRTACESRDRRNPKAGRPALQKRPNIVICQ